MINPKTFLQIQCGNNKKLRKEFKWIKSDKKQKQKQREILIPSFCRVKGTLGIQKRKLCFKANKPSSGLKMQRYGKYWAAKFERSNFSRIK